MGRLVAGRQRRQEAERGGSVEFPGRVPPRALQGRQQVR